MTSHKRCRFRDLLPNLPLGSLTPGPKNSITDIPGVTASTLTLSHPPNILTGVTAILPRPNIFHNPCFCGIFRFNGNGELTGSHWIEETGELTSPIMITNTFSVGAVSEGVLQYIKNNEDEKNEELLFWALPVVVYLPCERTNERERHMMDI
jgi:D-aminopeptidase